MAFSSSSSPSSLHTSHAHSSFIPPSFYSSSSSSSTSHVHPPFSSSVPPHQVVSSASSAPLQLPEPSHTYISSSYAEDGSLQHTNLSYPTYPSSYNQGHPPSSSSSSTVASPTPPPVNTANIKVGLERLFPNEKNRKIFLDKTPNVFLCGLSRCGKTSISKVVFHKTSPHETLYLPTTQTPVVLKITNTNFFHYCIVDIPGSILLDTQYDEVLFPYAQSIVYIIDAQNEPYNVEIAHAKNIFKRIYDINSNVNMEVFIHKIDGDFFAVDEVRAECQRDIHDKLIGHLHEERVHADVIFYSTSIYDHTIFEACSRVLQRLIPQVATVELLLDVLVTNCRMEKAFLIDVLSKTFIATDSSPFDPFSYELCTDMIEVVVEVSSIYGGGEDGNKGGGGGSGTLAEGRDTGGETRGGGTNNNSGNCAQEYTRESNVRPNVNDDNFNSSGHTEEEEEEDEEDDRREEGGGGGGGGRSTSCRRNRKGVSTEKKAGNTLSVDEKKSQQGGGGGGGGGTNKKGVSCGSRGGISTSGNAGSASTSNNNSNNKESKKQNIIDSSLSSRSTLSSSPSNTNPSPPASNIFSSSSPSVLPSHLQCVRSNTGSSNNGKSNSNNQRRSNKNIPSSSSAPPYTTVSLIQLNTGHILYVYELDRLLALACVTRDEYFDRQHLIDFNIKIFCNALLNLFNISSEKRRMLHIPFSAVSTSDTSNANADNNNTNTASTQHGDPLTDNF